MSKGSLRRPTLNKELADKNWQAFMENSKKKELANREELNDGKTNTIQRRSSRTS